MKNLLFSKKAITLYFIIIAIIMVISLPKEPEQDDYLVSISGHELLIPKEYLHNDEDKENTIQSFVSIRRVKLSNMQPATHQEVKLNRKSDDSELIKIGLLTRQTNAEIVEEKLIQNPSIKQYKREGVIENLTSHYYEVDIEKNDFYEYHSYINSLGGTTLIRCDRDDYRLRYTRKIYLICENSRLKLKEGLYAQYFFRKTLLTKADHIEQKIRVLINSFEYSKEQ